MKIFSIALSEQCNLNCSYCNVDKNSKKRIDPKIFIERYYEMRSENPDELIQIDFYGGEPLLQFDIVEQIILTLSSENNIKFCMPTNGLLLTEERLSFLNHHKVQLSLSYDGLWQDKNRLQLNGKVTNDRYFKMRPLISRIPNVTIHTMVGRGNYNLLENHKYILENFDINPELTLVRDIGTWNEKSVEKLKVGIKELFDWYKNNADSFEMPNFIKFYLRDIILFKSKKHVTKTCGAGESFFAFSENKVVPCNRFKDEPEIVAKIPQFQVMNKCLTCEVKNYCRKGCLYEQINNDGPIEELCDIYKYIYSEVFIMMSELKNNKNFVDAIKKEIQYEFQ